MGITQKSKSLNARGNPLSDTFIQLDVLHRHAGDGQPTFQEKLAEHGITGITPMRPEILQVNVGKLCNQSCAHCHVDAGPDRKEVMTRETFAQCLAFLKKHDIPEVDITGGAPELNPHFTWFVSSCTALGIRVTHRCNLTILVSHEKYAHLPGFFAEHTVRIVASMPHYTRLRTDGQRGEGVFAESVKALQMLNTAGYGTPGSALELDLVYNPSGAFLPSSQSQLEDEFKTQFKRRYGIQFNHLFAITNLPISRFLEYLLESGNYRTYMETLVDAFNPRTVDGLMCRNTLSVGWDGKLYDCDFNQMLELGVDAPSTHISDVDMPGLLKRKIVTDQHCYGCTAGAGSSCGGSVV